MTTLIVIGLIAGAYLVGRFTQWVSDARSVMGSRLGRNGSKS
jgi:hypothetical protein